MRGSEFNAWNPGLTSEIPARLLPRVTLFRPEAATVDYKTAKDAADFCGLEAKDMVAFRLERLIVHELLIRVTSDLSVPDGPNYEELGINLRGMVAKIFNGHIKPELPSLQTTFDEARKSAEAQIRQRLSDAIFNRPVEAPPKQGFLGRMFGKTTEAAVEEPAETLAIAEWQTSLSEATEPMERYVLKALLSVVGGIVSTRGRLMADEDIVTRFALNMVCNTYGSLVVAKAVDPIFEKAVAAEGYRFLPHQKKPFFMNVKGASASGKSTIRPQQRALAETLAVPWEDFALISPDYWRKYLLDYDSLGEDSKFGAMLTGEELEIIDKKLDAYMARKAATQGVPHLLIDRFRFDSFSTDQDGKSTTQLLTQYGDTVFLFFLVTPPTETVERAWKRGLNTGRFKAVDDLLYHNIEAYTGMPQLFLRWIGSEEKKIHFEFLDNSVPFGALPKTIAYGWNDRMTILDVEALHNIDRYRSVNVEAERPQDVLLEAPKLTFLDRCVENINEVTLVDPKTHKITARALDGAWCDVAPDETLSDATFATDRSVTLGAWG